MRTDDFDAFLRPPPEPVVRDVEVFVVPLLVRRGEVSDPLVADLLFFVFFFVESLFFLGAAEDDFSWMRFFVDFLTGTCFFFAAFFFLIVGVAFLVGFVVRVAFFARLLEPDAARLPSGLITDS